MRVVLGLSKLAENLKAFHQIFHLSRLSISQMFSSSPQEFNNLNVFCMQCCIGSYLLHTKVIRPKNFFYIIYENGFAKVPQIRLDCNCDCTLPNSHIELKYMDNY